MSESRKSEGMKPKLGEFFWTKTAEFWLAYQIGRLAGRPDEVGAPREAIVRRYLASILPPTIGVAKGHIIYRRVEKGELRLDISLEFDIILFDAHHSTIFPWDADELIKAIPFEYVYGIIEVKSILTDEQAKNVSKKKTELDALFNLAIYAAELNPRPSSLPSIFEYMDDGLDLSMEQLKEIEFIADLEPPDDLEQVHSGPGLEVESESDTRHPKPFFYVFCFSEKIEKESDACGYFCNHAGLALGKPDGVFIFDNGYFLRRKDDAIIRAIALIHGVNVDDASSSRQVADYELDDMIHIDDSYRRDYWRSESIQQTECLAAFLNLVSSSCKIAGSGERLQVDLGQLLGLWLKSSPVAATLGRFLPAKDLPEDGNGDEGGE